jgi:hypothetical protein
METKFDSSAALVESLLGRRLIPDGEHPLMRAAREWLTATGCPRATNAAGRGRYLVTEDIAERFVVECWPRIKHLAATPGSQG